MAVKRTHDQFIEEILQRNINKPQYQIHIKSDSTYKGLDVDMKFTCDNGHPDFTTKPRHIIQKGSGCPICGTKRASQTNTKPHQEFESQMKDVVGNTITLLSGQEYAGTYTKLQFECAVGHIFATYPKTILLGHCCPICDKIKRFKKTTPIQTSEYVITRRNVLDFNKLAKGISSINIQLIPINNPYDKYFYVNQLNESVKNNKQSIFIFEDEWNDRKELILSKLQHYSNQNDTVSIHARKCVIKQISNKEKKELLNKHHVQGNDNAPLSYGAYYNDRLVSVMTFSAPRVAVGGKRKDGDRTGIWELSRFCTDVNYRIPGIASKLLTHFKRNHEWKEIYSFADMRWSVGNMYYKLGFDLVATNPPAYFYVVNGKRKHRWNYRKDIIKNTLPNYDATLTEYQNMQNHGYWRVWDCGSLKFSMKNK